MLFVTSLFFIVLIKGDIACLQNINGMAHLKRTEFGKVDLEYVLGIGGFDLERLFSALI